MSAPLSWIARREWLDIARDRRLAWLAGFVALLSLVALVFGTVEQQRFTADRATAVAQDRLIWQSQGAVNPHTAAHFGMFAFRPRASLTAFDPGLAPWMGEAVWLEAHYQNPAQGRAAETSPLVQRFGDLSAAWILQSLLPLLIILAGFATVAGERERGGLKLQLVQGASAARLLGGKTLALVGLGLVIVLPLLLIAGVASLALSADSGDIVRRWALLLIGYTAYAALWAMLTVAVSALAEPARKSLVILLAFWAVTVVLLPRLAADTGARLHPTASAGTFWQGVTETREKGIDGHNPADARTAALKSAVLKRYGVTKVEDLPIDFAGISLQAGEDFGNQVYDRMFGELATAQAQQQAVALGFSPLTPVVALRILSAGLSGNDLVHQAAFTAAAEAHRRAVQRVLNEEQTAHGKGQNFKNTVDGDFWRSVPTFNWRPPTVRTVITRYAVPALILLTWLAAAGGLLWWAARRLEKSA